MHRHTTLITLSLSFTFACGGDPGAPVPDIDYCSVDAAQHACTLDSQYAGSYPAIDAVAAAAVAAAPAPGCAYSVSLDNDLLYVGASGTVDAACAAGDGCPWEAHHLSGVASVSKTLTAIAVLKLFETGRISGDPTTRTVGELLPDAPESIADLTVHQLLAHLSGLDGAAYTPSYSDSGWLADAYPEVDRAGLHPRIMWYGLKDAVVLDPTLVNPATSAGNYSNAGFRIVGAIVDLYTSYSADEMETWLSDVPGLDQDIVGGYWAGGYESYVRSLVNHNGLADDERLHTVCQHAPWREAPLGDSYVPSYLWNGVAFGLGPDMDTLGRRGPSGGWMMTVGDLARLTNGLMAGRFVTPETLALMRTQHANLPALGLNTGYGVMLQSQTFTDDPTQTSYPGFMAVGNISTVGYSAMSRIIELPDGRSVGASIQCNEDIGVNAMIAATSAMADQVYTDFVATKTSPISYDPSVAGCDVDGTVPMSPATELALDFGDTLDQSWGGFLHQADGDAVVAERLVRAELATHPEGVSALRSWDGGDLEGAALWGLELMWRLDEEERAAASKAAADPTAPATTAPAAATPATATATKK
jgi:CubicO group peptidase (beta-lactamase class C family)